MAEANGTKDVHTVEEVIDVWYHGKRVAKVTLDEMGKEHVEFLRKGDAVYDNFYYRIDNPRFAIATTFKVDDGFAYVGYYEDGRCRLTENLMVANYFSEREKAEAVLANLKLKDFLKVVEV